MKDLEINKIVASVLTGTLIALACGKLAHVLYRPDTAPEKRGYQVEVTGGGAAEEKEVIPFPVLLAQGNAKAGGKVFKKCVSCHNIEDGAPNKTGPNLYGIVGKDKGSVSGFAYSSALQEHEGDWTIESLKAFLTKPSDYMPGTKMSFNGLKNEQDLANVILYLREQGSTNYLLPVVEADVTIEENDGDTPPADTPVTPEDNVKADAEDNISAAADTLEQAEETIEGAEAGIDAATQELKNSGDSEEVYDMTSEVIENAEDVSEAVDDAKEAVEKALEATEDAENAVKEKINLPDDAPSAE